MYVCNNGFMKQKRNPIHTHKMCVIIRVGQFVLLGMCACSDVCAYVYMYIYIYTHTQIYAHKMCLLINPAALNKQLFCICMYVY